MRVGASHRWKYITERWNETKVSPKKWLFTYKQHKVRLGRKAPKGSGLPLRSRLHWKIIADQYAIKTSPNDYRLVMKGKKYRVGYKYKKDRKWR